jgi:hypothetical protein
VAQKLTAAQQKIIDQLQQGGRCTLNWINNWTFGSYYIAEMCFGTYGSPDYRKERVNRCVLNKLVVLGLVCKDGLKYSLATPMEVTA